MYVVLTGETRFPFYQFLITNTWESTENSKKMVILHCRVITKLLKGAGAIPRGERTAVVAATPFDRAHLNRPDFRFKETLTHYVPRDEINKRKQHFPKPVEEGQEEEEEEGRGEFDQYGGRKGFLLYPNHPVGYQDWSPYERTMYDRQEYHWKQQKQFNKWLDRRVSRIEQTMDVLADYQ